MPEHNPDEADDPGVHPQGFESGLVAPIGAEDNEHPVASTEGPSLRLQRRRLTDIVDWRLAIQMAASLERAGRQDDVLLFLE